MKEKLKLYLDSIKDYIFVIQSDKIIFANLSAMKLLKIKSVENIHETDFYKIFPTEEAERLKYQIHNPFKGWEYLEDRLNIIQDHKVKMSVHCRISKLIHQNEEFYLFHLIDITNPATEPSKQKDINYKNRELLKTNSIRNIAAGISHNFNNALASMSLAIETLRLFTDRTAKANELLDKIINISHRMSRWTNQLLCYAKGGKYIIKLCSINESIITSLETLKEKIPNWITITHELAENLTLIKADPAQMEEVFNEIILNSIESLKENGRIEILTQNIAKNNPINRKTKKFANHPCVNVTISDNGCGMNEDVLIQIFEPFFSTKFQGRGLGLSSVWGIIENHDGEVCIESHIGRGTTFEIFFPLPEETEISFEEKKDFSKKTEEKKIVVISEDENNRFIIKTILENYGYEVFALSKLDELIFTLRSSVNINLIYLDQSSFKKEDFDKIYPDFLSKPDTKIVVSLSYNNKEIAEKLSGNKNVSIVYKPFKYEEIVEILRKLLKV